MVTLAMLPSTQQERATVNVLLQPAMLAFTELLVLHQLGVLSVVAVVLPATPVLVPLLVQDLPL
jgi:hypothetical protein